MPKRGDEWRRLAAQELRQLEAVKNPKGLLLCITKAAELHGLDSDPDHEVGDLKDALTEAIRLMMPYQRQRLYDWWKVYGYLNG